MELHRAACRRRRRPERQGNQGRRKGRIFRGVRDGILARVLCSVAHRDKPARSCMLSPLPTAQREAHRRLSPLLPICYDTDSRQWSRPASERAERFPMSPPKKPLRILLASPRGFCAICRARHPRSPSNAPSSATADGSMSATRSCTIAMSWRTSKPKDAIFVETLDEEPDDRPGGVLCAWRAESRAGRGGPPAATLCRRHLPAGAEVHRRGRTPSARWPGRTVVLIGHAGHPEKIVGTMGQLPAGQRCCWSRTWRRPRRSTCPIEDLIFAAQTPLSVDDTISGIVDGAAPAASRRSRVPKDGGHLLRHHQPPGRGQGDRLPRCDALVVIGAPNSSNSMRLVEVAPNNGCA